MNGRSGFTLPEALVGLLSMAGVLVLCWTLVEGVGRSAVTLADRGEVLATARATAWVLQEELHGARAALDLGVPSGDSFSLRAFRGTAWVCSDGGRDLVVSYGGLRAPDAAKDSVLALSASGRWSAHRLRGRARLGLGCRGSATSERWGLDPDPESPVLLRLFESGSYHLGGALRYRLGAGGRQPLTPVVIDSAKSGLEAAAPGLLVFRFVARGARRGGADLAWTRTYSLGGSW
jgi:hypothetical protein